MSTEKGISIYFPFRSFHNQAFDEKVIGFFLLPPIFNLITLYFISYITKGWGSIFEFFLTRIYPEAIVGYTEYYIYNHFFSLPHIDLYADFPDALTWWSGLIISFILFALSFIIPERFTPLTYLFRTMIVIIWCTLLFFLIYPSGLPYDISLFTKTGLLQVISIIFGLPWIFSFTYYLFGYRMLQKITLTTLALIYFIIFAPFQYLLSACLIHMYSLFLMPALYIYAGLLVNIFAGVAFFAYGLSIEQLYKKYKS